MALTFIALLFFSSSVARSNGMDCLKLYDLKARDEKKDSFADRSYAVLYNQLRISARLQEVEFSHLTAQLKRKFIVKLVEIRNIILTDPKFFTKFYNSKAKAQANWIEKNVTQSPKFFQNRELSLSRYKNLKAIYARIIQLWHDQQKWKNDIIANTSFEGSSASIQAFDLWLKTKGIFVFEENPSILVSSLLKTVNPVNKQVNPIMSFTNSFSSEENLWKRMQFSLDDYFTFLETRRLGKFDVEPVLTQDGFELGFSPRIDRDDGNTIIAHLHLIPNSWKDYAEDGLITVFSLALPFVGIGQGQAFATEDPFIIGIMPKYSDKNFGIERVSPQLRKRFVDLRVDGARP